MRLPSSDGSGPTPAVQVHSNDKLSRWAPGPPIRAALEADAGVSGHFITTYALPSQGVGVYVFAETAMPQAHVGPRCRAW